MSKGKRQNKQTTRHLQRLQVAGCLAYLEVSLSVCHGHSQVRDNAQSHHSAQAGRTPRACCIVANQVQLAVPGVLPYSSSMARQSMVMAEPSANWASARLVSIL